MSKATDVLVVGAGPTGLTLACALAAQGLAVRVVDRAAGPADTSRANILHARGVEVLDRLGALDNLAQQALAPMGMAMHVRSQRVALMRFAPVMGESVQALFVSQARIEQHLRQRLESLGVTVEWGTELTGLDATEDVVVARLGNSAPLRASWAVGCDGARSTVRGHAGIDYPGVPVVEQFLLADVRARWDRDRSTSAGWFHRDGILLAIPMRDTGGGDPDRGNLWRFMADVPPLGTDRRLGQNDIIQRFSRLIPERTGGTSVELSDPVWTSVFRIHRRLATDYRRGRILLAGDAAHTHSPIGGQGMNTGIGDAENLAWKLALVIEGRAGHTLLDTYTDERRPLAAEVLKNTTTNTKILVGEGALARLVRDRIFVPLLNLPAVHRTATRNASQLWVTYRKGPLGGRRKLAGLRPGDRVPDRTCLRTDGSPTRLHAELRGRWALLSPRDEDTGAALLTTARTYLGDRVTLLHPDDDAHPVPMLIRPDGHLGWHGPADHSELRGWLTRALIRPGVPA
ncbi:FAD-dependent oxidoreductase [Plantactinospora sp. GCM10030261]|uniref:FAD-dependent oxidoreductase n=1 Tax=Plantactinospora sp. GCM10030261 TaxID=3273420 RepID=UPI0036240403